MAFKFDIYHRDKNLTFGERFKGEIGKDIFAAKVALGVLRPISSGPIEGAPEFSFDRRIPLDQQNWFDCSTGLGVDIKKAATFDQTLENALLTFQINNQFLITCYYFEKLGFRRLLNANINNDTFYESEIVTQIAAAIGIFESELRTLGEATIAILHGWQPGTKLDKNFSYTHDERIFGDEDLEIEDANGNVMIIKSEHFVDILPIFLYDSLVNENYPQNFQDLLDSGLAVPNSLKKFSELVPRNPLAEDDFSILNFEARQAKFREYLDRRTSENRKWANLIGESKINFDFAVISYNAKLSGNSLLFNATQKVIDYYLENNLFSETRTPEQLQELARRATYPDPFVRTDPFVIDAETIGIYTETEFFLRAEGPLPPVQSNSEDYREKIKLLEELALIKALQSYQKPKVWYFLKHELKFKSAYFSSVEPEISPDHSGFYPRAVTRGMEQDLTESLTGIDTELIYENFQDFAKNNYWVLSTSDITNELPEDEKPSIQYWRTIDDFGNTKPLIKFQEFITPSLRAGQSYRALFLINREKFDLIVNGDNLQEPSAPPPVDLSVQETGPCLEENSDQAERTYEEFKAHAIKRRRELVREIRRKLQQNNRRGARIDLGLFDSAFEGININSRSDQEMISKISQLLPLEDVAELLGDAGSEALDWLETNAIDRFRDPANPDNDPNKLKITLEELEKRVAEAARDLKESSSIISREGIEFTAGSKFNGEAEAVKLQSFIVQLKEFYIRKAPVLTPGEVLVFEFKKADSQVEIGPTIGKEITKITRPETTAAFGSVAAVDKNDFLIEKNLGRDVLSLLRPRTINYIANIKEMTKFPTISSFFDDSRKSCQDLGINFEKLSAKSFLTKFTSGLTLMPEDPQSGFSFKSWWEEEVVEPIKEFGKQSATNFERSVDPANFDKESALRVFGELCTVEQAWAVFNKLDLTSLICDYVKCLKLPAFDFKAPDFRLDPPPETPIFGWYNGLLDFLEEEYANILKRLGCTMAKMLIDKLAFPFCEEQLQDFIQSGLQSPPLVRDAIIESLTNTGVPSSKSSEARDFYDSVSNILTGRELCYILQGNTPDDASMLAIQKLASSSGVGEELQSPEQIVNFFAVIGLYLPDEFCEALNQDVSLTPTNCEETNSLLRSIRNRLQTEDSTLSEEEINNAIALAEKNKQDQADRLQALLNNGFDGMTPELFSYGDPTAILSDLPEHLKREHERSARNIFTQERTAYISDLSNFVTSLSVEASVDLFPYDERYNIEQTLSLETAVQQLADYAAEIGPPTDQISDGAASAAAGRSIPETVEQNNTLHQLYQTEIITSLPEDLIPERYRDDLESFLEDREDYQSRRYKLPQVSNLQSSISVIGEGNDKFGVTTVDGALVHKRRMKTDSLTFDEIIEKIESLNVLRRTFDKRVSRTSGETRAKVRALRRPVIRRINDLIEIRDEMDPDGDGIPESEPPNLKPVSYEFFLQYQQIQRNLLAGEEHPLGLIEFELVPFSPAVYSKQLQSANFLNEQELQNLASQPSQYEDKYHSVFNSERFSEIYRSENSLTGNANERNISREIRGIADRAKELGDRIVQILQQSLNITDNIILPELQNMLSNSTEKSLERLSENTETVSSNEESNSYEIKFNVGSIYSPAIKMVEIPANSDKDRYDIEIEGDYYLGLQLSSSSEPPGVKKFRFCDPVNAGRFAFSDSSSSTFGKRTVFQKIIGASLKDVGVNIETNDELKTFLENKMFKLTTERIIENLLDSVSQSRIFSSKYVTELDKRVSGRRIIRSNCVSNRFSFGDGSVVSFDKTIIDDFQQELAKEKSRPENAPENSDFDSPTAFQYAIQNLSLRGFVRACLIDTLLKGSVSYAVWDVEPIINQPIFIKYIIQHVRHQLETNSDFSSTWARSIERTTGISNKYLALESMIREEIVKLPNYSKQVYHPQDQKTDFSNWFETTKIKHLHVGRFGENATNARFVDQFNTMTRQEMEDFQFDQQIFIIEHYISIKGNGLIEASKDALSENFENFIDWNPIPYEILEDEQEIILSAHDFRNFVKNLTGNRRAEFERVLATFGSGIFQGARIVLVDPGNFAEDRDQEFATEIRSRIGANIDLNYDSERLRSYSYSATFNIPLAKFERKLDLAECYSLSDFENQPMPFADGLEFTKQELLNSEDTKLILGTIFPIKRLMAIASIFSTSIISGYSRMPYLLVSTKNALANTSTLAGLGRQARSQLRTFSQEEFLKQLTENFPTDGDSCFEFPSGFESFFEKFFKDLWDIFKYMPSIILRGIANQLDPAYKEMRQHYINCDINQLNWRGIRAWGTAEYKLTNGLYLKGRSLNPRTAPTGLQRKKKGKYVPLVSGLGSDVLQAIFCLPSTGEFAIRMGIAMTKLTAYIYSGNQPFLDPSAYFKVPCQEVDYNLWKDKGKFDTGIFGRYGHPLSPFTVLALSTPQLKSDIRLQEASCLEDGLPEQDCEELNPEQIVYLSDSETEQDTSIVQAPLGTTGSGLTREDGEVDIGIASCVPWSNETIQETLNLINRYNEMLESMQLTALSWGLLRNDRSVYDSRSTGGRIGTLAGGTARYDAGERVDPIEAYIGSEGLNKLKSDIGTSQDASDEQNAGLIHPNHYEEFINLRQVYDSRSIAAGANFRAIYESSMGLCNPENSAEIRLFLISNSSLARYRGIELPFWLKSIFD